MAQAMNNNRITTLALLGTGLLVFTLLPPACAKTDTPGFERYRVIVDRKPFGELSPPEDAPVSAAPQESFAKNLELRAIIDDGNEIRVGMIDKQKKENIYLTLGETVDGIELVSVDYDNEEATLRKGTETSVFTLKPPAIPGAAGSNKTATVKSPPAARTRRRPLFSNLKKSKLTTVKGEDSTMPFRGKTIEAFIKEHPEAALQYPSPIQPPDPTALTQGRGETIERFLRENPDAARQFSPIQPPDPTVGAQGMGEAIEQFLRDNSGEMPLIQPPVPVLDPSMSVPFPLQEVPVDEMYYEE